MPPPIGCTIVVGYQNKPVAAGFSLTLPTFDEVGGGEMDIQKIVPQNIGENVNGEISIQTFTTGGTTDKQYFYQTTDSYWGMAEVDGWYLDDYATLAEKTLSSGVGMMVDAPADVEFTYAGEVSLAKKTVKYAAGFSLAGNLRPMKVDIQDIVLENIGENVNGEISIQTFTVSGTTDKQYFYQTTDSYWGMAEVDGWYLDDYATLAEKEFEPGEGFMLDTPAEDTKIAFKAIDQK